MSKFQLQIAMFAIIIATLFSAASQAAITALGHSTTGTFHSDIRGDRGVSSDGTVAVGVNHTGTEFQAFRWTSGGGMASLGDLAGGGTSSEAYAVSSDGSIVAGTGSSASGTEAYRWTSGTGMVGLGDLTGGIFRSVALSASHDGSVIAGWSDSANGHEAFHWTSGTGMVGLGDLPGGSFSSEAVGVSGEDRSSLDLAGRQFTTRPTAGPVAPVWSAWVIYPQALSRATHLPHLATGPSSLGEATPTTDGKPSAGQAAAWSV